MTSHESLLSAQGSCPRCSDGRVAIDDEQGLLLCTACGFVVDELLLTHQAPPQGNGNEGGKSGGEGLRGAAWCGLGGGSSSSSRSTSSALMRLKGFASSMQLPASCTQDACRLWTQVREGRLVYTGGFNNTLDAQLAGTLYLAARLANLPVTLAETAAACSVAKDTAASQYKSIKEALHIHVPPPFASLRRHVIRLAAQVLQDHGSKRAPDKDPNPPQKRSQSPSSRLGTRHQHPVPSPAQVRVGQSQSCSAEGGAEMSRFRKLQRVENDNDGAILELGRSHGKGGRVSDGNRKNSTEQQGDWELEEEEEEEEEEQLGRASSDPLEPPLLMQPLVKLLLQLSELVGKLGLGEGRPNNVLAGAIVLLVCEQLPLAQLKLRERPNRNQIGAMAGCSRQILGDMRLHMVKQLLQVSSLLPMAGLINESNLMSYVPLIMSVAGTVVAISGVDSSAGLRSLAPALAKRS